MVEEVVSAAKAKAKKPLIVKLSPNVTDITEIARAAVDTDGDGIPDHYEELLGLDPKDASDAAATTLDPQKLYSNIEVYLHYLVRDITLSQVKGGSYTALQ